MTIDTAYMDLPKVITPEIIASLKADVEWWKNERPVAAAHSKGAEMAIESGLWNAEDRLREARKRIK